MAKLTLTVRVQRLSHRFLDGFGNPNTSPISQATNQIVRFHIFNMQNHRI